MMFDYDSVYGMEGLEAIGADVLEGLTTVFAGIMAIVLAGVVIGWLVGAVLYVIRSLSLYTIAQRRGLKNPWLSWIPVGRDWIIGSLSDQFKYLTEGKNQSRRKILLGLSIGSVLVSALSYLPNFLTMVFELSGGAADPSALLMLMIIVSLVVFVVSSVVSVAKLVFHHMSMYEIYRSCNPKNAVLFLVLGILFSFTEPFFLLSCRNKDLGMPPRKKKAPAGEKPAAAAEPAAPAKPEAPAAPAEEPAPADVKEAKPEVKPVLLGIEGKPKKPEAPEAPPAVIPLGAPAEPVEQTAVDETAPDASAQ